MGQAEKRAAADQKRSDIILQAIKDGMSVKALAARIGVEEDYAKKLRRQVAAKHGLTTTDGESPELAFGLAESGDSYLFRNRVANMLVDLVDRDGLHPVEVAMQTGVPEKAQTKSKTKPYPHDWKLSELERLAAFKGMTFIELMEKLIKPRLPGEIV